MLLGNGVGGFTPASGSPFAVGSGPFSSAVGDFNQDGKLDLATANSNDNTVTILLGDGAGGFTQAPGSPFTVGSTPYFVVSGDFDGDGKLDLATANADGTVTVLLGDGAGGITPAPGNPFAVGAFPPSIAVGDFNRDGKLDLATANADGTVTVLLGARAKTTSLLSTTAVSSVPYGTPVPLTLTVSAANALSTPSGTVTFRDGSTVLGTASQTGSPYIFTTSTLAPGVHQLTATYSGNLRNRASTSNTVTITVSKITPVLTWPAPAAITFGSALSSMQLDATANVPGTFAYSPGAGTVLPVGNGQRLSVIFTPTDTTAYSSVMGSTTINVIPSGGVPINLVVTKILTRSAGNVLIQLTVANTGQTDAAGVVVTSVTIVGVTAIPLPVNLGTIAAESSATTTVSVPGSVGAAGTFATVAVSGTYSGGSFSSKSRIILP